MRWAILIIVLMAGLFFVWVIAAARKEVERMNSKK